MPSRQGIQHLLFALGVAGFGALFVFGTIGNSVWADEANTALSAKAILNTGGLSARVDDHNLLMYRNGSELKNLRLSYLPPAPAYLTALSFKVFGFSSWSARLPFVVIRSLW